MTPVTEAPRVCSVGHMSRKCLPGAWLCQAHADELAAQLTDIRIFHSMLDFEMQLPRGREAGNSEAKTTKRPYAPGLTRLDVLAMLDPRTGPMLNPGDVPNTAYELGIWTGIVADERDLSDRPGPADPVPEFTRFLERHLEWLIAQEYAPDMLIHLRTIKGKLAAAVGQSPPRPFAHCIAINEERECRGPLRLDPYISRAQATCPRCRRVYAGADLIRLRVIASREQGDTQ